MPKTRRPTTPPVGTSVAVPTTPDALRLINAKIRLMEKEAEVALLHERAAKRQKAEPEPQPTTPLVPIGGGAAAGATEAATLTSTVTQLASVIRDMKEDGKAQTRSSRDGDQVADLVRGAPASKQGALSLHTKGALALSNQMDDQLRELKQSRLNAADAEQIRDRLSELQTLNGEGKSAIFNLLEIAIESCSGPGSKPNARASQCYEWCVLHPIPLLNIVSNDIYLSLCSPFTWRISSLTSRLVLSPFRAFIKSRSTFTEIPYSLFSMWVSLFEYPLPERFCTTISPAGQPIFTVHNTPLPEPKVQQCPMYMSNAWEYIYMIE